MYIFANINQKAQGLQHLCVCESKREREMKGQKQRKVFLGVLSKLVEEAQS